jgi:hypothetical protein
MQAYTVMRECIASLGMIGFEREGMNSKKRKKRRKIHAEIFVKMFQHEEKGWDFGPSQKEFVDRLKPFYRLLEKHGIEKQIRGIASDLADYRNGFDHAWTCKTKAYEDIAAKGFHFLEQIENIIQSLDREGLVR